MFYFHIDIAHAFETYLNKLALSMTTTTAT